MDRDWHACKIWCGICDQKFELPSTSEGNAHQPWEAQGRSLSDADGSEYDEDDNSDDDHLANACPAVMVESHWDEWEDAVEDFSRSLPDSEAAVAARSLPDRVKAVAASTLDRGEYESIKKHMNKHLAPAMPTIAPEERPHREKLRNRELAQSSGGYAKGMGCLERTEGVGSDDSS